MTSLNGRFRENRIPLRVDSGPSSIPAKILLVRIILCVALRHEPINHRSRISIIRTEN